MKKFEIGREYRINGGGILKVIARTPHTITFEGTESGRKAIESFNLFGLGESVTLGTGNFKRFCFASHEA